ncbi:tyrosine-type recombinase/integrase [Streptomyces sp. TG1A-8]|uniref:tyrosine-type recombinase/integrase n=1 Tax=Streptomyces sp. TG1A-8 TaxID=3051385 RepID=UPI00265B8969|nr:site-specific integrase [Streptomyces sp. TG1A-8]MDO0925918.1 tyrosine-type recombinase/integrase [Streptomyces sp. TG1A-8]
MAQVLKKCDCQNKTRCAHLWTVRYREPGGRTGRQREKSFPTKREAESFGVKAENDKRAGVYIDHQLGQISMRKWAEEWLAQHQVNESTRRNYRGFISNHLVPALGARTLASVTIPDVKKLQTAMVNGGLAASTVNDRMNILRAMMATAVKERRIYESPCDGVPPIKTAGAAVDPDEIPTLGEVYAIAAAMSDQYRLTVWLQAGAGLRISEALGLTSDCQRDGFLRLRRQISAKANQGDCVTRFVPLKHRTADEYRDVPTPTFLDQEIGNHLKRWGTVEVDGVEALFAPRERGKGKMPTASTYGYHWRKACVAAGVVTPDKKPRYTPHSLRHFFASTALANGVPIHEVSRWLGHRNIKTTVDTYGHLVPEAWDRCRDVMQQALRPSPVRAVAVAA